MKTEKELHALAAIKSSTVVARHYEGGTSYDTRREPTAEEKHIVERILFGGLYAIEHGADKQSVLDTCEMIGIGLLPQLNTYDTIYNELKYANPQAMP